MSYGVESWGTGSWGGADFIVSNQIPADMSINVSRLPTISFTLLSQSGNVILASINLTVNAVAFITSGAFTINATGTIDNTNPAAVQITANAIHEYSPQSLVTVNVSALNASNQIPSIGNTWQFTVDGTIRTFQTYIVRKFERVLRVGNSTTLTPPTDPHAIVDLGPPTGLAGVTV